MGRRPRTHVLRPRARPPPPTGSRGSRHGKADSGTFPRTSSCRRKKWRPAPADPCLLPGDPATARAPRTLRQLPAAGVPRLNRPGGAGVLLPAFWRRGRPDSTPPPGSPYSPAHFRILSGPGVSPVPRSSARSLSSLVYLTSQHVP